MLQGRVTLVAGVRRRGLATRMGRVGRGTGATVYCTGRSVRGRPAGATYETIEETAELVSAPGGIGIPVQVDHTVPERVGAVRANRA